MLSFNALLRKNIKYKKCLFCNNYCGSKFNAVFPILLFKNDYISRNDGSFSSLNNFKRLHCLNFLN